MKKQNEQRNKCILCGGHPRFLGVLTPTATFANQIDNTNRRVIGYALCAGCFELPDRMALVEAQIVKDGQEGKL